MIRLPLLMVLIVALAGAQNDQADMTRAQHDQPDVVWAQELILSNSMLTGDYVIEGLKNRHWQFYRIIWDPELEKLANKIRDRNVAISRNRVTFEKDLQRPYWWLQSKYMITYAKRNAIIRQFADEYMANRYSYINMVLKKHTNYGPVYVGCALYFNRNSNFAKVYCVYRV